jgi:hypothetical protein
MMMMMSKIKYLHKDKKSQCKFHQLSLPLSKEKKKLYVTEHSRMIWALVLVVGGYPFGFQ